MDNVTITIAGLGGCINYETILIRRLFEELGHKVIVNDEHPFIENRVPSVSIISETENEFINRVKALKHKSTITINTEHCPWGG